jgi:hypothetical protein
VKSGSLNLPDPLGHVQGLFFLLYHYFYVYFLPQFSHFHIVGQAFLFSPDRTLCPVYRLPCHLFADLTEIWGHQIVLYLWKKHEYYLAMNFDRTIIRNVWSLFTRNDAMSVYILTTPHECLRQWNSVTADWWKVNSRYGVVINGGTVGTDSQQYVSPQKKIAMKRIFFSRCFNNGSLALDLLTGCSSVATRA